MSKIIYIYIFREKKEELKDIKKYPTPIIDIKIEYDNDNQKIFIICNDGTVHYYNIEKKDEKSKDYVFYYILKILNNNGYFYDEKKIMGYEYLTCSCTINSDQSILFILSISFL